MADQIPIPNEPLFQDLTGMRFGRLTVIAYAGKTSHHRWHCTCDCGGEKTTMGGKLKNKETQSCGCLQRERASAANTRHGYTVGRERRGLKQPEYKIWGAMISRCYRENDTGYADYGGRGITVCDRWRFGEKDLSAFQCFISDMGPRPSPQHSIERVNNSIGYMPSNCVWAGKIHQIRNRRNTIMVEWRGKRMALSAACEIAGLSYEMVTQRIHALGWSVDKALTQPKMRSRWG